MLNREEIDYEKIMEKKKIMDYHIMKKTQLRTFYLLPKMHHKHRSNFIHMITFS